MIPVIVGAVFAKCGLDLCGPLPVTDGADGRQTAGNKYILNIICWFSKYILSIPLPDARASTLATVLVNE